MFLLIIKRDLLAHQKSVVDLGDGGPLSVSKSFDFPKRLFQTDVFSTQVGLQQPGLSVNILRCELLLSFGM